MDVAAVDTPPEKVDADVLAFAVPDPVELPAAGRALDELVEGQLRHLIDDGELKGRLGKTTVLHASEGVTAHRIAAAGIGAEADLDADALRTAAAAVALL